ncbi:MAG: GTP 3',8-cyclase MoaA [bacterium]|nr:GTP 3',8-cyclase MoaA [bacterium]
MFEDRFGRVHDDLRVSVTDRCNLRCTYCMPSEPEWFDRESILTFEEIVRLVRLASGEGVRKVRLTGGEPLLRRNLPRLISMLDDEPRIESLSLTTNGLRLQQMAPDLATAGLQRINVSLDTLDPDRYKKLTRRYRLDSVLRGLDAAQKHGLSPIKINVVVLTGVNEDEIEPMVERGREKGWEIRFIEFMPLENGGTWNMTRVVTGEAIRERIARRWPIEPEPGADPTAPAARWRFVDGRGRVGFIDSVSAPFCTHCTRLRLTADGMFRVCLYDDNEVDLKGPMRSGASDDELIVLMRDAVRGKRRGGALEILEGREALPLTRTMHQIGG